jgi:hypothetical protein
MEILKSKRVRIAVAAIVVWGAARFGLELDAAAVDRVLDLAMVVIASFGLTGFGKERSAQELAVAKESGGTIARVEVTTIPPPIADRTPTQPGRAGAGIPLEQASSLRPRTHPPGQP